jgi:hypothetical protein
MLAALDLAWVTPLQGSSRRSLRFRILLVSLSINISIYLLL